MQNLLTRQDVAEFLGVSTRQVARYEDQGLQRVGGMKVVRYSKDAVNWFLRTSNIQKLSKSKNKKSGGASPLGVNNIC